MESVLIVDDAPDTLEVLDRNLTSKGYRVFSARSVSEATRILDLMPIDLVITDYKMPQVDGFDLVQYVNDNFKETEVMMITGYPSISGAIRAIQEGASDYLEKPFTEEELFKAVDQAFARLQERRAAHTRFDRTKVGVYGIIGESESMLKVFDAISKAASTSANALITGESGTGKELVARAIHYRSERASFPFIPVNCGGIPEGLLESELFGHVKGSFTGASSSRDGFFQAADRGTIFLDEISETSLRMQVKLLRVLQDKEVRVVGNPQPRKIDVRIVAATNKNLRNLIDRGLFREDLFYRLSIININVPPLRDRGNDVLLIARDFISKYSKELGQEYLEFSENALRVLKTYSWPGNVRELENLIQRLMVMTDHKVIKTPDLPSLMRASLPRRTDLFRTLEEVILEHIQNVLSGVGGNKSKAAEILGIDRKTLRQKIKSNKKFKDIDK